MVSVNIHKIDTIKETVSTRKQDTSEKSYVRCIEFWDKDEKLLFQLSMFAENPQSLVIQ